MKRNAIADGQYGTYVEMPLFDEAVAEQETRKMIEMFAQDVLFHCVHLIDKMDIGDPLNQRRTIGIKCEVRDGELIFKLREGYNNESET